MILLITASAAVVFMGCLLRLVIRRGRRTESAYTGFHRGAPSQSPNSTSRYAPAGAHSLGMNRKSSGR